MLYKKPVIIATCCAIAFVVGVYFGGSYYLSQGRPDETSTPATEKPTTTAVEGKQHPTTEGHWHGDVWHSETDNTPSLVQEDSTAEDSHEIVWTIESLQGPLTDLEKQLLKTPLPALTDETGNPRPFDSLTHQEQKRVIVERRAIDAELKKRDAEAKKVEAAVMAGNLTIEELKKWREGFSKGHEILRARVEALPR